MIIHRMAANSYSPVRIKQLIVHQHKKLTPGKQGKNNFQFPNHQAISRHPCPLTVTIDKSSANRKAIDSFNADFTRYKPITVRQNKYLNNRIEQDHRGIKRRIKGMLGFKSLRCAQILLAGIELMHMFRKGQFKINDKLPLSPSEQYYALVA